MSRLAAFTFGNLHGRPGDDHPGAREFYEWAPSVFGDLDSAPGLLSRSGGGAAGADAGPGAWGEWVTPDYGDGRDVQTLSLWSDLESLFAGAYGGKHLAAMRKRKEWFKDPVYPSHVLWWVDDDHTPTWQEACERHHQLHEDGPTASAFSFRSPFDDSGATTRVDQDRVKELAATR